MEGAIRGCDYQEAGLPGPMGTLATMAPGVLRDSFLPPRSHAGCKCDTSVPWSFRHSPLIPASCCSSWLIPGLQLPPPHSILYSGKREVSLLTCHLFSDGNVYSLQDIWKTQYSTQKAIKSPPLAKLLLIFHTHSHNSLTHTLPPSF